ncbi:MAG: PHB depolymerase family esterase [Verrucomicrobiota bacterium JB023]|nr:PHB depolymerase family esterase [Verrucomicrobiota bacterium JB023]
MTRTIGERSYLAYLPDDYASRAEPMQVLVALHPATFDGEWFQKQTRFEDEAAAEDIIILYPDGSEGLMSGLSWDAADPRGISRGDADFIFAALADIATLAPTKEKFAVTGFSAGALMTYRLLCDHGDQILAAVPYGAYYNDNVITESTWPATVPLLHMHGEDDGRVNPLTGEGEADLIYRFGILSDHMTAVASRNNEATNLNLNFASIETALDGADVVEVNASTSYVLLEGIAHYWPGPLLPNGPNGSAAVLDFINQVGTGTSDYPAAYQAWLLLHPALTETQPDADPDGDGLSNLLEWLMGFDPTSPDLANSSYPTHSFEEGTFQFTFPVASAFLDEANSQFEFYGETNTNLVSPWSRVDPVQTESGLWQISVPTTGEAKKFLRLTVAPTGNP